MAIFFNVDSADAKCGNSRRSGDSECVDRAEETAASGSGLDGRFYEFVSDIEMKKSLPKPMWLANLAKA